MKILKTTNGIMTVLPYSIVQYLVSVYSGGLLKKDLWHDD